MNSKKKKQQVKIDIAGLPGVPMAIIPEIMRIATYAVNDLIHSNNQSCACMQPTEHGLLLIDITRVAKFHFIVTLTG